MFLCVYSFVYSILVLVFVTSQLLIELFDHVLVDIESLFPVIKYHPFELNAHMMSAASASA
jgi:hypothetical protein